MTGLLWRRFEEISRRHTERPALIQGGRSVSFSTLHDASLAAAAALADRGLMAGARCLIQAPNSPELAAAVLGAWRLGAIVVLVSDEAPPAHLRHAFDVTGPSVMVRADHMLDIIPVIADVSCRLSDLALGTSSLPDRVTMSDGDPASIFFTSGSSGRPKGVTQSHATLHAGCMMVAERLGYLDYDRLLCPIPWSFDYGYGQFLTTVLLGLTQILPEARNPFSLCQAIGAHGPTVFAGLPSLFAILFFGLSPIHETDLRSIRLVTSTGGKIPPNVFTELQKTFGHAAISLNYGMTETYRSAGLPIHLARARPDSVGLPYPGVSIAIAREDGTEAGPGELGEIVHRGTGTCMGYWGDPEATSRLLRPDPFWHHKGVQAPKVIFSGDLGWKDDAGFLYIKGRKDRLIKSMGVRVSPDEIEALLRSSGLVRDAAVVGVAHKILGEMVAAAILPNSNTGDVLESLKRYVCETMSKYMQPRVFRIVDAFPITPNGKTDFAAVRALFGDGRS